MWSTKKKKKTHPVHDLEKQIGKCASFSDPACTE